MTRPPDADARITEARRLLGDLGFDAERSNERSASVLLALLALAPSEPWSGAVALPQGTLAIMRFIETEYGHKYAANTRETIRRSTLHQFADELLVVQNPDKPDRAVNSPKWCYQIEAAAVALAHTMGTDEYSMHLTNYLAQRPGQKARQAASRKLQHLRVRFAQDEYELSPGGQNEFIVKMLDEFCPRFTPDAEVLYLGDADDKWLINKTGRFEALGVEIDHHGKMPDVVVWMPDREWLVLLEAVKWHGPVDTARRQALRELFAPVVEKVVLVSCFPDRATMRKYLTDIAWETEVWCADHPDHLIHFNGERFLGPYS